MHGLLNIIILWSPIRWGTRLSAVMITAQWQTRAWDGIENKGESSSLLSVLQWTRPLEGRLIEGKSPGYRAQGAQPLKMNLKQFIHLICLNSKIHLMIKGEGPKTYRVDMLCQRGELGVSNS